MDSNRYYGQIAKTYDAVREGSDRWHMEQRTVESILEAIHPSSLLDLPFGTGRFIEVHQRLQYRWIGVDISEEMLNIAREKDVKSSTGNLFVGNATALELGNDEVDTSLCIRLLNLLTHDQASQVLGELSRVSQNWVVFGARIYPDSPILRFLSYLQVRARGHKWRPLPRSITTECLEVVDSFFVDKRCGSDYLIFLAKPR